MGVLQKSKGFLLSPKKSFDAEKKASLKDALKYMLVLQLVFALGTTMLMVLSRNDMPLDVIITNYFFLYIYGTTLVFIIGLWTHLWAYFLGARNGLGQTLKAAFYGGTPVYLLGWIPESIFREYAIFLDDGRISNTLLGQIISALGLVSLPATLLVYSWFLILLWLGLKTFQNMDSTKSAAAIALAVTTAIYALKLIISAGLP